ncbi:uncharacterized protein OCT59_028551 [Rhizophagus irregularis]|uniref:uncharacterized protein n=1 Tax=Rhizophagus irregularis TaxID=588596 RepID=UPI0019EB4506|nr:hypothetical protein OCT59_028551 [Rhizophagus irregularis]GBC52905.2 hypothetical protein RIR_jg27750.t1 [Rhizophagus irregularis DAOM 181602=DAOM 197198]
MSGSDIHEKDKKILRDIHEISIKAIKEVHTTTVRTCEKLLSSSSSSSSSTILSQTKSINTVLKCSTSKLISKTSEVEDPKSDKCTYCFKRGHWLKDCQEIPDRYKSCCFKCWRSDSHKITECPSITNKQPLWLKK